MKTSHTYYVYILKCKDESYYTGITNNLDRRLHEHQTALLPDCYTHSRRPVELCYFEIINDVKQAITREKQIKGWGRKKKEALIEENWEKLKLLSKSKNMH